MHKTKNVVLLSILMIMSLLLGACTNQEKEVISHAEYKYFNNVEELVHDADIIVIGSVSKVSPPQLLNINVDKNAEPHNEVNTISRYQYPSSHQREYQSKFHSNQTSR